MNNNTITIERAEEPSSELKEALRRLTPKLGRNYKPLSDNDIADMLASPNTHLLLAKTDNGTIAGMVTVVVYRIPYVKKAYVDDLVVDEAYRGLGIARQLMEQAIALAREKDASYVDLTSRPQREAGNILYEKMGFQKRDTNVYRLRLNYEEI